MKQVESKEGAKRPPRKQRINVTLFPETIAELEKQVPEKQRSALIERLVRQELGMAAIEGKA